MTQPHEHWRRAWRLPGLTNRVAAYWHARGGAAVVPTLVLVTLSLLALVSWGVLYRWYSLSEHFATPYFAFEKVPGQFDSPTLRYTLLLFLGLSLIYLAGYWLIKRAPQISTAIKLATITLVVGPGIANILLYPAGALDVFNYMIVLKLAFHYQQNPYVVTFEPFRDDPFTSSAFLVDVPLFYGPAWLLLSGLPAALVGFDDPQRVLVALKAFNFALLVLTALAIYQYQDDDRRGWLAAYTFVANPLVLFEGVANAHNDVLMTLFLAAAVLALKRRSWLAALFLTLSALVKFFTVLLVPLFALAMLLGRWSTRKMLVSGLLALAVAVAAVVPFWAEGEMLEGLARGTKLSQEMDHVSVFSLVQQQVRRQQAGEEVGPSAVPAVQRLFGGLFVAGALLVLWGLWRGWAFERALLDTLLLFFLLLTNLYPWYLIPVIAVLALKHDVLGSVYLFAATALGLIYYPFYVWGHFHTDWSNLQTHQFLALFLTLPMVALLALEVLAAGRSGFTRAGSQGTTPGRRRRSVGALGGPRGTDARGRAGRRR